MSDNFSLSLTSKVAMSDLTTTEVVGPLILLRRKLLLSGANHAK